MRERAGASSSTMTVRIVASLAMTEGRGVKCEGRSGRDDGRIEGGRPGHLASNSLGLDGPIWDGDAGFKASVQCADKLNVLVLAVEMAQARTHVGEPDAFAGANGGHFRQARPVITDNH